MESNTILLAIFFIALSSAGALWAWSLLLALQKRIFLKYFLANALTLFIYSYIWYKYSKIITGHDEYGLGMLFGYMCILIVHSFISYFSLKQVLKG